MQTRKELTQLGSCGTFKLPQLRFSHPLGGRWSNRKLITRTKEHKMATVHSVVELNGNGTIRRVVQTTFNEEEAARVEQALKNEGANNRCYTTLSGQVDLPKVKAAPKDKAQ
jgi:hypothetical protein